jgi:hypothetical protein
MIHRVKTNKGVSKGTISWSKNQNIQFTRTNGVDHIDGNIGGIGQGGGGSPVGWLVVLLVMIATYSAFASGIIMADPQSLLTLTIHIISYVDDNTLVQSFDDNSSMGEILGKLNDCISKWHSILRITGGDLALEKCTFCILKWKWKNGQAEISTPLTDPGELDVMGTTITRLKPNEGTRVLGVRLAMDGTFGDEYKYRLEQSKSMAAKLYQSHLSPLDSFMVYETRYRPALEYPLRVTTFTTSELQNIQKPFIFLLLPKIGLNRHMPRDVIYGPIFRGGLGLVNLEERQIIQHFEVFQGHLRRNDDLGKSIRIQLATQQLEIGCGEFFINTNPSHYAYGTSNTRLSYLWKQSFRFHITVSFTHSWVPAGISGLRQTIMDYAVDNKKLRGDMKKLALINSCRLYLKLLWPEDLLVEGSSTLLDRRFVLGTHVNVLSELNFPTQGFPSTYAWSLWKEFIYGSFCVPCKDDNGCTFLTMTNVIPRAVEVPKCTSDFQTILESISASRTLAEKFACLPDHFKHIIGQITLPEDEGKSLIEAMRVGKVLAASDGSYLEQFNKGSHAYKLVDCKNPEVFIQGSSMCPASDKMSSSPAEHYGAIAVLLVLTVLLHHHDELDTRFPTLTLLIDNEEVVDRGNKLSAHFLNVGQYLTHDYDLWSLMAHFQVSMKMSIAFEWIKGHQEGQGDEKELFAIDLNNQVDALATDIYAKNLEIPQRGIFFAGQVCYHQQGYHVQDITNAITARESDQRMLAYYTSKGWSDAALLQVDWSALGKFLKTQSPIVRCNTVKLMHNWQNTGSQKRQFSTSHSTSHQLCSEILGITKPDAEFRCPLGCGHAEIPFHYMHCTSDMMMTAREQGIATLTKQLKKIKTAPSLTEAILQGIHCWTYDTEYELTEDSDPLLFDYSHSQLLHNQGLIGWEPFMKGFVAKDWKYIQGSYYAFMKLNKRKYHQDRWILQLLMLLHKYRHDLWMLRNASIHGGFEKLHGKALRWRLITEVTDLYDKDRSSLSLVDKNLFKLPLQLRKKQGNQQLLLWVKHAHMIFAKVEEEAMNEQQAPITDWLTNWTDTFSDNKPSNSQMYQDKVRSECTQTNLKDWLKSCEDNIDTCDDSSHSLTDDATGTYLDSEIYTNSTADKDRFLVADEVHQHDTTNTCILVN